MSPVREAIGLPVLFLTIALLGGFRVGARVLLVPPSLTALILAVLLLGVLVRAGAFRPSSLPHLRKSKACLRYVISPPLEEAHERRRHS